MTSISRELPLNWAEAGVGRASPTCFAGSDRCFPHGRDGGFLLMLQKQQFRKHLIEVRKQVLDKDQKSKSICEQILSSNILKNAKTVALYSAVKTEADPSSLALALEASNIETLFPKVLDGRLQFHKATQSQLVPGYAGILEPSADHKIHPIHEIDIWIIPGLGFSRQGARIGYGKGHYDKALAEAMSLGATHKTIGFGFSEQLTDEVPLEPHDVPLDIIAVENEIIYVPHV